MGGVGLAVSECSSSRPVLLAPATSRLLAASPLQQIPNRLICASLARDLRPAPDLPRPQADLLQLRVALCAGFLHKLRQLCIMTDPR